MRRRESLKAGNKTLTPRLKWINRTKTKYRKTQPKKRRKRITMRLWNLSILRSSSSKTTSYQCHQCIQQCPLNWNLQPFPLGTLSLSLRLSFQASHFILVEKLWRPIRSRPERRRNGQIIWMFRIWAYSRRQSDETRMKGSMRDWVNGTASSWLRNRESSLRTRVRNRAIVSLPWMIGSLTSVKISSTGMITTWMMNHQSLRRVKYLTTKKKTKKRYHN